MSFLSYQKGTEDTNCPSLHLASWGGKSRVINQLNSLCQNYGILSMSRHQSRTKVQQMKWNYGKIIKIPTGLLRDRIQGYIVLFVLSKSVQLSQCEGRLQFPWFHGVIHITQEGRRQSELSKVEPVQVEKSHSVEECMIWHPRGIASSQVCHWQAPPLCNTVEFIMCPSAVGDGATRVSNLHAWVD